jgi:predicted TIM-barrel fold metal-dependent hydrolase
MDLSRRHFIAQAAAASLAGCSTFKSSRPGWIDAHVHVWTPDTQAYPLAPGFTKEGMKPASFTPEQLFAHCKPEGVDRIVLIQMSYYATDNRYMLDMIAKHRGVFRGVAIVDETKADVASTMKSLAKQGVRGFRITPGAQPIDAWLGSDGMATMWKTGADENLAMCGLINPEALPLIDQMCERFPKTPVVIDHFARLGMAGPVKEKQLHDLCRLARHDNVSVKTSAFYALGEKKAPYLDLAPMIRRLKEAFGPQRLMWASDCPFQVDPGYNYHDSIALIRDRLDFLTTDDKDWLLRKTAERVFFS